jgi:hypothetical protein
LNAATVEAINPPVIKSNNIFLNTMITDSGSPIKVPESSIANYESATGWSSFTFTAIP